MKGAPTFCTQELAHGRADDCEAIGTPRERRATRSFQLKLIRGLGVGRMWRDVCATNRWEDAHGEHGREKKKKDTRMEIARPSPSCPAHVPN